MKMFEQAFQVLVSSAELSESSVQSLDNAIQAIEQGVEDDRIWNVDYTNAKDTINRAIEQAARKVVDSAYTDIIEYYRNTPGSPRPELSYYDVRLSGLNSCLKKISKDRKSYQDHQVSTDRLVEAEAFINELLPIHEALTGLKSKIVKGRKPNGEGKPVFVPTIDTEHAKMIDTMFRSITAELRDKQIQEVSNYLDSIVENFLEKAAGLVGNYRNPYRVFKSGRNASIVCDLLNSDYLRGEDYSTILNRFATREVDNIHNSYIHKNVNKLAAIVGKKNNLQDISLVSAWASSYNIESTTDFSFGDGSRFRVINKAVFGYSKYGTAFVRFPTTFHDVIRADGSTISHPSEEKMNLEF